MIPPQHPSPMTQYFVIIWSLMYKLNQFNYKSVLLLFSLSNLFLNRPFSIACHCDASGIPFPPHDARLTSWQCPATVGEYFLSIPLHVSSLRFEEVVGPSFLLLCSLSLCLGIFVTRECCMWEVEEQVRSLSTELYALPKFPYVPHMSPVPTCLQLTRQGVFHIQ